MLIKERWKNLKHWQKFGVFAAFISILLFYDPIYYTINRRPEEIGFSMALLKSILYSPIYIIIYVDFIPIIIIYFIFGAAFGQLYFELKNLAPLLDRSRFKGRILAMIILFIYFLVTGFAFLIWFFY